jgi:peptidyl-prolyl cis-trans isomerase A (cyclophilin A)
MRNLILLCAVAGSLLASAQSPSFVTALPSDVLAIDPTTGAITYGIQLDDADSDSVTLSATSNHPGVKATASSSNRYARLNIVESDGTAMGSIVFEIFEIRGGESAARFIAHATTNPNGGADPFYTDSAFHRVANLPGLILQAGQDSSGAATDLGSFDDQFGLQDGLNFSQKGVVAMANAGPNTNSSEFFITDGATTHLDGKHMIFGQVISGQSVITAIGDLPRNGSSRPQPTPRIDSVDILDALKGGALSIRVQPGFAGDAAVTVIAKDDDNNRVEHIIQVHVSMTVHAEVLPAINNPVGTAYHAVRDINGVLYVANGARGLEIYEAADPTNPVFLDRFDTAGTARHVAIAVASNPPRTVAFVSDSENGFYAVDVSNPANTVLLDHVPVDAEDPANLDGTVYLSQIRDGIAYVAEGDGGFSTLDVSDPTDILGPLGSLDLTLGAGSSTVPARVVALALNGDTAYASLQNFGVIAIAIDNPGSLLLVPNANDGFGSAWGMAFENDRLYVTQVAGDGALRVYDVSSPRSFEQLLATHQLLGYPWQVDVRGPLVVVAHSPAPPSFPTGGFSFLDISNPSGIGTHFFHSTASAVSPTIGDELVLLPLAAGGVLLSDVSVLNNPEVSLAIDGEFVTTGTTVDFGTLLEGGIPAERTLTIYNDGTENLTVGAINLPSGYSRIGSPPPTLLPGTFAELSIRLNADSTGSYVGELSFSSNDPSENPVRLALSGQVNGSATVSGIVTTLAAGNPPLVGLTVTLAPVLGGASLTAQTAADGSYTFSDLVSGSYLLSPTIPDNHLTASPPERAVLLNPLNTVSDADFVITPKPASISGFIWDDTDADGVIDEGESPIANLAVQLFQGDTLLGPETTHDDGRYSFSNLEAGDYRIQPGTPDGKIPATRPNPRNQTVDWGDTIQFADFNFFTPPVLSVAELAIAEEAGAAVITLNLSFDIGIPITAEFATLAESADAGSDFAPTSGSITIPARATSTTVTVPIIDDGFAEFAETFLLTVSNLQNATLQANGEITITDSDPPRLDIYATTPNADEAGPVTGLFTIQRRGVLGAPITVDLVVSGSSDAADYSALPTTLTFTPSDMEKTVTISPILDNSAEGLETVTLTLQRDPSHRIGADSATVTIADGDTIDLAISITGSSQALDAGAPIPLSLQADNLGSLAVPSTSSIAIAAHLSLDDTFGNNDDIALEQFPDPLVITNLPGSSNFALTPTLWIPATAPAGSYRLIVRIDSDDRFDESDETNNIASTSVNITLEHEPRGWRFPITVSGAQERELRIGMLPGASQGIDSFDIGFVTREGSALLAQGAERYEQDIRPLANSATWRLQVNADAEDVVLSWDSTDLPSDRGLYVWNEAGGATDYFMQVTELRVPAGSTATYLFEVSNTQSSEVSLQRGWNLLALPLAPLQPDPVVLFGSSATFSWSDGWLPSERVTALEALWLFARRPSTQSVVGMHPTTVSIDLAAGWHAYGPATAMPASALGADIVWGWTGRHFTVVGQLEPGRGYLFHSSDPLTVTLNAAP